MIEGTYSTTKIQSELAGFEAEGKSIERNEKVLSLLSFAA